MRTRRHFVAAAVLMCASLAPAAPRQVPEDESTRRIWDTSYIDDAKKPAAKRAARRPYRVATPRIPVAGVRPDSVLGVTVWRLRRSRPTDASERMIVQEGPEATEWVPERVSPERPMSEGDRFRVSIEAARTGYLYVVDQEAYADGSKGEPMLIFPTTRTRGGDNAVTAGRVVEIPAQDDSPPFFTLKRSRSDHVAERMIVLVSPTPIDGLTISDRAQRVPVDTLASWEKAWGAPVGRLVMAGGEGASWTRAEREAGADGTRSLTASEPLPQTVYYRPGGDAKSPVMITVELRYAAPRPSRKRA